jgi:hypothetical protein
VPAKLTTRQEAILAAVKEAGQLTPPDAGTILHRLRGCTFCKPGYPCQYAEANGREVLEALRKKGLLKRDRHHVYRRATELAVQPAPREDDIPY